MSRRALPTLPPAGAPSPISRTLPNPPGASSSPATEELTRQLPSGPTLKNEIDKSQLGPSKPPKPTKLSKPVPPQNNSSEPVIPVKPAKPTKPGTTSAPPVAPPKPPQIPGSTPVQSDNQQKQLPPKPSKAAIPLPVPAAVQATGAQKTLPPKPNKPAPLGPKTAVSTASPQLQKPQKPTKPSESIEEPSSSTADFSEAKAPTPVPRTAPPKPYKPSSSNLLGKQENSASFVLPGRPTPPPTKKEPLQTETISKSDRPVSRGNLPKIELRPPSSRVFEKATSVPGSSTDSNTVDRRVIQSCRTMKLPDNLKFAIEKKSSDDLDTTAISIDKDNTSTESITKGKRPRSKSRKGGAKSGTLRFFGSKSKTNLKDVAKQAETLDDIGIATKTAEEPASGSVESSQTNFNRSSMLIAQALASRNSNDLFQPPLSPISKLTSPRAPVEEKVETVTVGNSFSKPRVARVEFGPENTTKAITITTRTSPLEAFEGMMNKISKGLPPERRDTLVAKYAKYTLYRRFEDGELEQIYDDEPLLSPMQLVGGGGMPKFLFTDQKVDARTREGPVTSINLGCVMQETHMKEEKKADNAVDEILITERKFLFDTDLILQMVLKPLTEEEILPAKTRNKIFLNIQQINSFHRELYRRFQIDNSISGIAAVFSDDIIQYMGKVYSTYLGYYENALAVFYSTRDHSEKFRKFLARLSAESPVFKDKSLNNLLVTPMQRVCKYELLLRNVISQEKKREQPDESSIKKLKRIMNELNITLQRIDKRRIESDDWEKILQLEEKLNLSEPLRKRGRMIIAEGSFKTTRRTLTGSSVSRVCSVVLFNDILLRAYKSNKTGEFKVLDISPLNHLVLIDPRQIYASVQNSITMCNIDPRGAILEFYFSSEEERQEWYQFLVQYTVHVPRLCSEWGIPNEGQTGTETIYAVDNCAWNEAYIERCRIIVTRNYVVLAWEQFGMTQKELIPLENITDIEGSKDSSELLKTNLWKENYHLKKLNNYSSTSTILHSVWQNFRRECKASETPRDDTSESVEVSSWTKKFSFSSSDSKSVWGSGKRSKVKEGKVVLKLDVPNNKLFMVSKGVFIQTEAETGDIAVLSKGDIFGSASFLDDTLLSKSLVTAGQGGATYVSITRDEVRENLGKNPALLAKLFATIARSLIK